MENCFKPVIEGVSIIKTLYKTKLSTIWLGKLDDAYVIVKGKKRSETSNSDFEFLKRERAFLESNNGETKVNTFPRFVKSSKDEEFLYMIISFFEGADLSTLIKVNSLKFNLNTGDNEELIVKKTVYLHFIAQIINQFDILHKLNYIYRDLKMNNLIINKQLEIHLIDFGFLKKLENNLDKTSTICGTYHAMAPEMFALKFGKSSDYSQKVDIYSLGVLFFELYTSKPPFPYLYEFTNEKLSEYYELIADGVQDSHFQGFPQDEFGEKLKNLIKDCMNVDQDKRLTLEEIKVHPVFEDKFNFYLSKEGISKCTNTEYMENLIEIITFNGEFIDNYEYSAKVKEEDIFEKFF